MLPSCENIVEAIFKPLTCCDVWTDSTKDLDHRKTEYFRGFMPIVKTAIVLGHHCTR